MGEGTMLSGAPLAVIEVDTELRVTGWNERAAQVFGVAATAALGHALVELLPLAGTDATWSRLLDEGGPGPRVWPIRRAGGVLQFEAWSQVTRDAEGGSRGAALVGHDASTRVAAERRAALESTVLRAIKEYLEIEMWAIDRAGTILYQDGNSGRAVASGVLPTVGRTIFDLGVGGPNLDDVRRALAGEPRCAVPREANGAHWQEWHIPAAAPDSAAAVVGLTLDVTRARRGELELRAKLELIEHQQEVIRELSTPIIEVWDGVLTLPIVGLVDSARTADIMDELLTTVARTRSRFAVLDLTGVKVVDTGTAGHLIGMIQAIRLLGAEGILTGIHPSIAQTIVALGVDLARVAVFANLRDALRYCIVQMDRKRPRR